MILLRIGILLLISLPVFADSIFYENYESYYSSLPNTIFKTTQRYYLQFYSLYPNPKVRYYWEGKISRQRHAVDINPYDKYTDINIDGHSLKLNSAYLFPGELADTGTDLGINIGIYFSTQYVCIEGSSPSGSGTADRYRSVYFFDMKSRPFHFFKLPSLFGSCLGIRLNKDSTVFFDRVDYRHDDLAHVNGVIFREYMINEVSFIPTGKQVVATFINPSNVFKFTIQKPKNTDS